MRGKLQHVIAAKRTGPSARALDAALGALDYAGEPVRWGFAGKYADKGLALTTLAAKGIPTPQLGITTLPCVARRSHHTGGSGFWLCRTMLQREEAYRGGATHHMDYIEDAREFRVHIVNGESIKISEKVGGGMPKSFKSGARFIYPHDFNHKLTLRKHAKAAVEALELSFGAVDILYLDGDYYVLEVNTAPRLTTKSDTCGRYARAFVNNAH